MINSLLPVGSRVEVVYQGREGQKVLTSDDYHELRHCS